MKSGGDLKIGALEKLGHLGHGLDCCGVSIMRIVVKFAIGWTSERSYGVGLETAMYVSTYLLIYLLSFFPISYPPTYLDSDSTQCDLGAFLLLSLFFVLCYTDVFSPSFI